MRHLPGEMPRRHFSEAGFRPQGSMAGYTGKDRYQRLYQSEQQRPLSGAVHQGLPLGSETAKEPRQAASQDISK